MIRMICAQFGLYNSKPFASMESPQETNGEVFLNKCSKNLGSSPLAFQARSKRTRLGLFIFFVFIVIDTYGMNLLLRPYDTLIRPEVYLDADYQLAAWMESGVRPAQGFNGDGMRVNPFAIWQVDQNALAMLQGFGEDSPLTELRNALDAQDDDVRGHLLFNGDLQLDWGGAIGARWYFLPHAWFTAYLPFYKARLSNVCFVDRTGTTAPADFRVRNMLTTPIRDIIAEFGEGLDLNGWKRSGPGDFNLMVEWMFPFEQQRPLLKLVEVDARVGFTFPTGLKADEDKLLAFPFGYDGAVGILYGGGLNVKLGYCFKAGFDVQLLHLFGNTRNRRIKTSIDQSDILLLAKTPAYKDYGLTQRFNLFVQAYHVWGGLSALIGYQFLKHGEDHLALDSCLYSTNFANSAASLDEWIVHSVEFNLHYDFAETWCQNTCWAPQLSLFSRLPFNGKRSIAFTTVGVMLAIDF